jgi:hypothetical protein
MNCANHTDQSAVAYCRTCGKPLCANCTRDVRGVIYCENCLAARLEGTLPPSPAPGVAPVYVPHPGSTGPNPTVAGILGAIPFGVGAVYNGQYAKGLAHLVIFALLCWGANEAHGGLDTLFGLGVAFFWFYQIFDAVRSARAIQAGQPAPDPFGLAQAFGAGEKVDTKKIPIAAIVLIGLGVLFLLQTLDIFEFSFHHVWPVFLIGLGVWLFARSWGLAGARHERCYCEHCRTNRLMGPAILVTIGVLGFLSSFREIGFVSWLGAFLIVIGVVKLIQGNASMAGHIAEPPAGGPSIPPPPPGSAGGGQPQPPVDEVRNV